MNTTKKDIELTQTAIKTAGVLMPAKEVISVKIRRIQREVLFQKYEVYLLCLKSILMLIIIEWLKKIKAISFFLFDSKFMH